LSSDGIGTSRRPDFAPQLVYKLRNMASYTRDSSELLQKLDVIPDLNRLQILSIRVERLKVWLQDKRHAQLGRLAGDTSFLADLCKANVHLLQLVRNAWF
jgi:hypothetical protein